MASERDFRGSRSGPRAPAPSGPRLDAGAFKSDVLSRDPAKIDTRAEELAQSMVSASLTPSQVRNFYGAIARIRAEEDPDKQRRELAMHRSRLAYLTARAEGNANSLWEVFGPLLKELAGGGDPAQVSALCDFAEAVVAYHKYHEWKNKRQKGGGHDPDE